MGIRFFCPHCQSRLNVKSSQAGGAGVCPDCGATIDVPEESILPGMPKTPGERFYIEDKNPPEGSSQLIGFDTQDTLVGDFAGESKEVVSPPTLTPVFATSQGSTSGIFMLDRPSPSPDFGKVDPISAAPEKVWYFRDNEIGERGPLKSKAMQQHVDAGDVAAGSMVWREDWDDWAAAEDAFPQISAPIDPNEIFQTGTTQLELANLSNRQILAKQLLFYGAIFAGLAVVAALAYLLIWIAHT